MSLENIPTADLIAELQARKDKLTADMREIQAQLAEINSVCSAPAPAWNFQQLGQLGYVQGHMNQYNQGNV